MIYHPVARMNKFDRFSYRTVYLCLTILFFLAACDRGQPPATEIPVDTASSEKQESTSNQPVLPENNDSGTQFNIGNKSYLFDVSNHSLEELEALLERAQEISQVTPVENNDLEIVMILHGPDIDWFTQDRYEENRKLIELAEKLDEFEVIDMKVCETAMNSRGVKREDIPAFIESVPYAPDEIRRLLQEGYINL